MVAVGLCVACLVHTLLLVTLYRMQSSMVWLPDWGPAALSTTVGLSVPIRRYPSSALLISTIFIPVGFVLLALLSVFVGCSWFGDCL